MSYNKLRHAEAYNNPPACNIMQLQALGLSGVPLVSVFSDKPLRNAKEIQL